MGDIKEYWNRWLWRDATTKIITINVAVWIVLALPILFLSQPKAAAWLSFFALPPSLPMLATRPWTVLSYMFAQVDFLHLLVNMMWLLLFGRLYELLLGQKRLFVAYLIGGLAGAAAIIILNAISASYAHPMLGASSAVICVLGATTVLMPNFKVNLLIFGEIKIIWIAIVAIVLFVILEPDTSASVAHSGGLLAGLIIGFARKAPRRVQPKPRTSAPNFSEAELDSLLAKVAKSGYASLSAAERQRLFDLSQKIKK